MAARFLGTILLMGFLVQLALIGVTHQMQLEETKRVGRLCTDFLWTVRQQKEINTFMVKDLEERLNRRAPYSYALWLQRQIAPGIYSGAKVLEPENGLLRDGDRILLRVTGKRPGAFGRLLEALRMATLEEKGLYVEVSREFTV